jgi:hypothetical protein
VFTQCLGTVAIILVVAALVPSWGERVHLKNLLA